MKKLLLIALAAALTASPAMALDFSKKRDRQDYEWAAQKFVQERLKDPDSAKFRNVRFNMFHAKGKDMPAVCGEVNSKNSFGAMTGFQRFVSVPPAISAIEEETDDFPNIWNMMCK